MSKVVVFGGSGFIGSHLADALTEKGYDVVVFDQASSPYINDKQKMVVGSILDREKIREVIKGSDYVFHLAAIADIAEAREKPVETIETNVLATTYILDACREYNVKRFLFASTVYVYSEHGSFYKTSKQACELIINMYNKTYGTGFSILRFGSLYGSRANDFNFIYQILKQAFLDGKIEREGDGDEIREYINVLDAARVCVEIMEDDEFHNEYVMLTGQQSMKIKELLNMIKEILNESIDIEYIPIDDDEHYKITPYSFKPTVAKKYLPQYYHDLGQGILECMYETYEELLKAGKKPKIEFDK